MTMLVAAKELQIAWMALLSGDATFMATITNRLYDDVPENEVYPYVRIGEFTATDFRTLSRPGEEVIGTVHIFSRYSGNKEVYDIGDEVQRLLGDISDLSVANYRFIASWYAGFDLIPTTNEAKVITRHGRLRYRMKVQQTSGFPTS